MEICEKMSDRELQRVCQDATEKALHQYFNSVRFTYSNVVSSRLVYSRQFVEFMSENRLKQTRTVKTYKALTFILLSLFICSSVYYWRTCGHIIREESTPQKLTSPAKPEFCQATLGFPEINWNRMADWKEERSLFLWKLVERYNQKRSKDSKAKIVKWLLPKNWRRRILKTPWDGPFLTLAEGVYDRVLSLIPYRSKSKIENQDQSLS